MEEDEDEEARTALLTAEPPTEATTTRPRVTAEAAEAEEEDLRTRTTASPEAPVDETRTDLSSSRRADKATEEPTSPNSSSRTEDPRLREEEEDTVFPRPRRRCLSSRATEATAATEEVREDTLLLLRLPRATRLRSPRGTATTSEEGTRVRRLPRLMATLLRTDSTEDSSSRVVRTVVTEGTEEETAVDEAGTTTRGAVGAEGEGEGTRA